MTPPDFAFIQAVQRLKYWLQNGNSFTCQLYALMAKADNENRDKLARGFPVEFEVFHEWTHCLDPNEFFAKYLGDQNA